MADGASETDLPVDEPDALDGTSADAAAVKGAEAAEAADAKALQRKAGADAERRKTRLIGVGLLVSLVIGFGPLRDAMVGNGSFEGALGRYLLCLGFSIVAMLTLGRILETAPAPAPDPD